MRASTLSLQSLPLTALTVAVIGLAPSLPAVALDFRSIDGSGNNRLYPDWGTQGTQLIRLATPAYDDGYDSPRSLASDGSSLANPRDISNVVVRQPGSILNSLGISNWIWQWGQLVDHDLDFTQLSSTNPSMPISVNSIDLATGLPDPLSPQIPFQRNDAAPGTGTSIDNPRQQINGLTSYLDGSVVYGSTQAVADALRASNGKLQSQIINGEELLPFKSTPGMENIPVANPLRLPNDKLFVAGDERVNEQLGLTAIQTLLMREHNRLADDYSNRIALNDTADPIVALYGASGLSEDDFIYQTARKVVGAQIQVITYNEFLPMLIGATAIAPYTGYKDDVNASISNEFANAAFRLGHTLLSPELQRVDNDGNLVGSIALDRAFFNSQNILDNGVDTLLMGLAFGQAQELDNMLADSVRNLLFGANSGGSDLAAVNIERGREVGLPSLNQVRLALGLTPYTSFAEINPDLEVIARLSQVYQSVDDVDLWLGGIVESHYSSDILLGETFRAILIDQFTRLRDGDRFFYLNDDELLAIAPDIEQTTLAELIQRDSTMSHMPKKAFLAAPLDSAAVPEPSSVLALLLLGIGGFYLRRGRD